MNLAFVVDGYISQEVADSKAFAEVEEGLGGDEADLGVREAVAKTLFLLEPRR